MEGKGVNHWSIQTYVQDHAITLWEGYIVSLRVGYLICKMGVYNSTYLK